MSERNPEMFERWCAYHTAAVQDGKDSRGLYEIVADFAATEVRRALVAELELLRAELIEALKVVLANNEEVTP